MSNTSNTLSATTISSFSSSSTTTILHSFAASSTSSTAITSFTQLQQVLANEGINIALLEKKSDFNTALSQISKKPETAYTTIKKICLEIKSLSKIKSKQTTENSATILINEFHPIAVQNENSEILTTLAINTLCIINAIPTVINFTVTIKNNPELTFTLVSNLTLHTTTISTKEATGKIEQKSTTTTPRELEAKNAPQYSIMIVDDELVCIKLLTTIAKKTLLEMQKEIDVISANSSQTAFEIYQHSKKTIIGIITDFNMSSGNNGAYLTNKIIQESTNKGLIPPTIIGLTGAGKEEQKMFIDAGAKKVFIKPIQKAELIAELKCLIGEYFKSTAEKSATIAKNRI